MIRIILPAHLRTLAHVSGEITLNVKGKATIRSVLDALEKKYPMLAGTIRDHGTLKRRPLIRFFVCQQDISLDPSDTLLPKEITNGTEPFMIVGAIAGG